MFKVTFMNVAPRGIEFKYAEMSRTEAVAKLPELADDFLPGQMKSTINRWDKQGFQAIYVVTLVDSAGKPRLNIVTSDSKAKFDSIVSKFSNTKLAPQLKALQAHNPHGTRQATVSGFSHFIDVQGDPECFQQFIAKHPFRKEILSAVSH